MNETRKELLKTLSKMTPQSCQSTHDFYQKLLTALRLEFPQIKANSLESAIFGIFISREFFDILADEEYFQDLLTFLIMGINAVNSNASPDTSLHHHLLMKYIGEMRLD